MYSVVRRNPRGIQTGAARGHGPSAVQARAVSVHAATGDQHRGRLHQHAEDRGPGHRPRGRVQLRRRAHSVFQHGRVAHGRGLPVDRQRPLVPGHGAAAP